MSFFRKENFFDHFDQLANKIAEGGLFFLEMTRNHNYSAARVSRLKEIEHEADVIAHKTYARMHKSFLTPLDREDIYALVNKMDNIMDAVENTAVRLHMYQVKKHDDAIILQTEILLQAIEKVRDVVGGLRNMKNSEIILDGCVEIHTLENAGDAILRTILKDLFLKETDAIELLKWKEIFELLEEAVDGCENVSHVVEGIIMKHA